MLNKNLFFYLELPIEEGFQTYVFPLEKNLLTLNLLVNKSLDYRLNCLYNQTYLIPYENIHYKLEEIIYNNNILKLLYGKDISLNKDYLLYFFKKSNIVKKAFNSPFLNSEKFFYNKEWYLFTGYDIKSLDLISDSIIII